MTKEQILQKALEDWLVGLVRSGQPEGCTGAIMVVFWGTDRAEVISAMPTGTDLAALAEKIHNLADSVADGDGIPLTEKRDIPLT